MGDPTLAGDVNVQPGDVLAERYRVERVIGRGGMATIALATHLELNNLVAIKLLHETITTEDAVQRFLREARAIFPLRSENVCRVLDVGRLPNKSPFIVMEFLEGQDFATAFRGKRLDPGLAASYIAQACNGLAEAHALGIVHRDVKPANLFLTKRGDGRELVKVLDFGISKIRASDDEEGLTREGQVMGTPRYMAPEQFGSSRTADARADVWSVGLVLYKLVAGELPYDATSVADIYAELMNQPPTPILQKAPEIDAAFAAIVMRCLERSASKRFADARELSRALEPFAKSDGKAVVRQVSTIEPENPTASIVDTPALRPSPRRSRAVFALVAFLLAAGVAAVAAMKLRAEPKTSATATATTTEAIAAPPPPSASITPVTIDRPMPSSSTVISQTKKPNKPPAKPSSTTAAPPYSAGWVGKF